MRTDRPTRRATRRHRRRRNWIGRLGILVGDLIAALFSGLGVLLGPGLAPLWRRMAADWRRVEAHLPNPLQRLSRALARRLARCDPNLKRSTLASIVVHVIFLIVFSLAWAGPRRDLWPMPPLRVTLVDREETVTQPVAPAAQEAPPEVAEPASTPEKEAPKLPVRKKPKPKPKRAVPKRPAAQPEPVPQVPEMKPQPSSRGQLQMAGRVDETSFDFDYYLPRVAEMISAAWKPPAGLGGGQEGPTVTVRFRIARGGEAREISVEAISGLALFDRSALDAVREAQPFLPLPPGYSGEWLTVHLRFALTEDLPVGLR